MPYQFDILKQEIDKNRDWLDQAIIFINKFLNDKRFYKDQMSKIFLKQYNSGGFEKSKDFLPKLRARKKALKVHLAELKTEQMRVLERLKDLQDDSTLKQTQKEFTGIEREIEQLEAFLKQKVKSEMIKSYKVDNHLTDAEILHWVHHYGSSTCNRTEIGTLAFLTEEYVKQYLEDKAEDGQQLNQQDLFLSDLLETVAVINTCAAMGAKAMQKTMNPTEDEEEMRKLYLSNYLNMASKCIKHIKTLAMQMNSFVNGYYATHPEAIALERLTIALERLKGHDMQETPNVELMNLMLDQEMNISSFNKRLSKLNDDVVVVKTNTLTQQANTKNKAQAVAVLK